MIIFSSQIDQSSDVDDDDDDDSDDNDDNDDNDDDNGDDNDDDSDDDNGNDDDDDEEKEMKDSEEEKEMNESEEEKEMNESEEVKEMKDSAGLFGNDSNTTSTTGTEPAGTTTGTADIEDGSFTIACQAMPGCINTYLEACHAARISEAKSFTYNGSTYYAKKLESGMIVFDLESNYRKLNWEI
jgi:hypothetical protein